MRWTSGTSMSSAYRINTPHVHITVRGTTFDLLVEPQRTWVMLEAGEIEVCTVNAPRRCKTLSRSGDTLLAVFGALLGASRDAPSDFGTRCLSAGPPCTIPASLNQPPPPSSNQSRGGHRRADRTPRPGPTRHGTSVARAPGIISPGFGGDRGGFGGGGGGFDSGHFGGGRGG
jgi:hypothetical protein